MTPDPIAIDYGTIAGQYSALAGVLAGFAFAGLIQVIATHSGSSGSSGNAFRSILPLVSAFVGLITSSLNYAVIAGQNTTPRAALLETIGGLGFAAAGMMLFHSLLVFVHGTVKDSPAPSSQLR